ncbi:unnamed protein product, partial [Callosobruchus maculatus]
IGSIKVHKINDNDSSTLRTQYFCPEALGPTLWSLNGARGVRCPCDVSTFAGSCKLVVDLSTSIAFTAGLPLMKLDVLQTQPSHTAADSGDKCGDIADVKT